MFSRSKSDLCEIDLLKIALYCKFQLLLRIELHNRKFYANNIQRYLLESATDR